MAILKEQMSELSLLSELADPHPIIRKIRQLIPAYTGHPGADKTAPAKMINSKLGS